MKLYKDGVLEGTPEEMKAFYGQPIASSSPAPTQLQLPVIEVPRKKKNTRKHVIATGDDEIPFSKFVPMNGTEATWSEVILKTTSSGGWHKLRVIIAAVGFDKSDASMIYRLRSMIGRMQIGRMVVVRRSSPMAGAPYVIASIEEDATKPHPGIRVWNVA